MVNFNGSLNEMVEASVGIMREEGMVDVEAKKAKMLDECIKNTCGCKDVEKRADDDFVIAFEDAFDAKRLYSFIVESGLASPGEVILDDVEDGYNVTFSASVVLHKPEVVRAAISAYYDRMDESEDGMYEDAMEMLGEPIEEVTVSGAPRTKKGNPFHDEQGRLSGPADTKKKESGSWAMKKVKLKVTGSGKDKKGGLMVKYGSTKRPCGREARKQGKNIRCRDGKVMEQALVDAILSGKNFSNLGVEEMVSLLGLKQKYMSA